LEEERGGEVGNYLVSPTTQKVSLSSADDQLSDEYDTATTPGGVATREQTLLKLCLTRNLQF